MGAQKIMAWSLVILSIIGIKRIMVSSDFVLNFNSNLMGILSEIFKMHLLVNIL